MRGPSPDPAPDPAIPGTPLFPPRACTGTFPAVPCNHPCRPHPPADSPFALQTHQRICASCHPFKSQPVGPVIPKIVDIEKSLSGVAEYFADFRSFRINTYNVRVCDVTVIRNTIIGLRQGSPLDKLKQMAVFPSKSLQNHLVKIVKGIMRGNLDSAPCMRRAILQLDVKLVRSGDFQIPVAILRGPELTGIPTQFQCRTRLFGVLVVNLRRQKNFSTKQRRKGNRHIT